MEILAFAKETRPASRSYVYIYIYIFNDFSGEEGREGEEAREQISPLSETTSRNSRYSRGEDRGPEDCRPNETVRPSASGRREESEELGGGERRRRRRGTDAPRKEIKGRVRGISNFQLGVPNRGRRGEVVWGSGGGPLPLPLSGQSEDKRVVSNGVEQE